MNEDVIIVNNLTKIFNLSKKQQKLEKDGSKIKVAVNDISFTVKKGEIFGLLGPNGAGKTTTLRILSTLMKPNNGDISINGLSVLNEPDKVRAIIGFLTSELKLEDFFTPNYLFDYFSALNGIDKTVSEARKKYLFEKFGVEQFKETKVAELSTGMKQKVSLIISLIHDPDIIIFDEPTNGLDIITAKLVTDFLQELKEQGKTIIISTHIFSLVEKICDRVGIILNGKMVNIDSIANLTKEKSLEDVFFDIYNKEKSNEQN